MNGLKTEVTLVLRMCDPFLKSSLHYTFVYFLITSLLLLQNGSTALTIASSHGHFAVVKLLLEAGAEKEATNLVRQLSSCKFISSMNPCNVRASYRSPFTSALLFSFTRLRRFNS